VAGTNKKSGTGKLLFASYWFADQAVGEK